MGNSMMRVRGSYPAGGHGVRSPPTAHPPHPASAATALTAAATFADHAYWCFHTLLVKRKWFTLKEING